MPRVFSADELIKGTLDITVPVFIDTTSWSSFTDWAEINHQRLQELQKEGLKFWIFEDELSRTEPDLYERHLSDKKAEDADEDIVGVTLEQEIRDKLGVQFHREKLPTDAHIAYKTFLYEVRQAYFFDIDNPEKCDRYAEFVFLLRRAAWKEKKLRVLSAQPALHRLTNADVFYLGSQDDLPKQQLVSIFGEPSSRNDYKSDVFMVMPFAQNLSMVYSQLIKPTIEELDLVVKRGDDPNRGGAVIMDEIWSMISACRVVIADCTQLNPNVFYEIGIAHAIGKEVILIVQENTELPFDVRHRRAIYYNNTSFDGVDDFKQLLQDNLLSILNPS